MTWWPSETIRFDLGLGGSRTGWSSERSGAGTCSSCLKSHFAAMGFQLCYLLLQIIVAGQNLLMVVFSTLVTSNT